MSMAEGAEAEASLLSSNCMRHVEVYIILVNLTRDLSFPRPLFETAL